MSGPRVFISYRREDCMIHAGRLAENLEHRAHATVFLDIESIPPGVSFPEFIEREIASCDVVLVMIGDDWLSITDTDGQQRIADPNDWVHLEIASALERGVLTIPVLVEGTRMPRAAELPAAIANLAHRNAVELRDSSWRQDVARVIDALPQPTAHEAEPAEGTREWPSRFTDNWFATNVPRMDDGALRALRAELYRRSWSDDEIAQRVMVHAKSESLPTPTSANVVPPAPAAEGSAGAFPTRFTNSWFAHNVPDMDPGRLGQLLALLQTRSWSDAEISDRVLRHSRQTADLDDPPSAPPGAANASPLASGHVDHSDPVARATLEAATELATLALDPTVRIRERHLADALARQVHSAVAERKLHIPGWDPQPGNVDVFTTDWRGRPATVIETKLKEGDNVFECLWDMAKVLSLETERSVEAGYLVTGTTVASWNRPVACAELFATGRHHLVQAIAVRYRDWWVKYILGDSRGRPLAVPDLVDVSLLAQVRYPMLGAEWELRAIRISPAPDAQWVKFEEGLPVETRE